MGCRNGDQPNHFNDTRRQPLKAGAGERANATIASQPMAHKRVMRATSTPNLCQTVRMFAHLAWPALVLAAVPAEALAYLDPVTGSYLAQGLIAAVMAVIAGVRSVRERILRLFRRRKNRQD